MSPIGDRRLTIAASIRCLRHTYAVFATKGHRDHMPEPTDIAPYLTESEASELTRFSRGTLRNMRSLGNGPRFIRVGKAIRYRRIDLIDWMERAA